MEYSPIGRVMVNGEGRIVLVNRQTEQMFGYTREELLGQKVEVLVPERFRARHQDYRARFLADPEERTMSVRRDLYGRRKDGSEFPLEISLCPLVTEQGLLVLGGIIDISERKRAEEELRKNAELLQGLYRRLLLAQENERRHIARELHDQIGQILTMVSIHLQAALAVADAAVSRHLVEGLRAVDRAIEQVRDLSLNLRPSVLDALGLRAALEWYAEQQRKHAAFALQLDVRLDNERLAQEVEISCFRIIQEALTNVARHARAQNVWVQLEQQENDLHLIVRDDGIGFDVAAYDQRGSHRKENLGLLNMQERAQALGGELTIASELERDATIRARIPVGATHSLGEGGTPP